jgi:signal transduction histidine kinase
MTEMSGPAMRADQRARWLPWVLDVGIVIGLAMATLAIGNADEASLVVLTLALVVLPLLVRRHWPLPVLLVVTVGAIATSAAAGEPWVQIAAVALASFTYGERAVDRTRSALTIVAVALAMGFAFVVQGADAVEVLVLTFVIVIPTWLAGDVLRGRRLEATRRREAMERELREREERLRAATTEERRHVARELHDIVAHAVSVMVIQAGAARQVLRSAPDRAEEALLTVETTGREAMTELRRFLGALSEDDEAAGLAPQPGIDELDTLLERVREAGLPVSMEVDGEPRPVPPSLDVTVFRIVQEALTNALRYAERAATLVRLTWEPVQLRVEILDDGPSGGTSNPDGRGLAGMRERASLLGGHVEAGPRVGGGFAVRAWLPIEGVAPMTSSQL